MAEKIFRRVMVLDDDSSILSQVERVLLLERDVEVVTCLDVRSANQVLSKGPFDLCIVDLRMPGVSGASWIQSMLSHKDERIRHCPILAIYGVINKDEVRLLGELGVSDILAKPFNDDALQKKLKEIEERLLNPEKDPEKSFQDVFQKAMRLRRYPEAESLLIPKLKRDPASPKLLTMYAEILMRTNKTEQAEKFVLKALEKSPEFLPGLTLLSKIYIRDKKVETALETMEKAQTLSPLNIDRILSMGEVHLATGRVEESERHFRNALKLNPEEERATMGLGRALVSQGKVEEGQKVFGSLENSAQLVTYFNNKGILLVRAGRYQDGINLYENALKILGNKQKSYLLNYNIALAYYRKGDLAMASLYTEKAVQDCPPAYEKPARLLERVKMDERGKAEERNKGRPAAVPSPSVEELLKSGLNETSPTAAVSTFLATPDQMSFIMGGFDVEEEIPKEQEISYGGESQDFLMIGFESDEPTAAIAAKKSPPSKPAEPIEPSKEDNNSELTDFIMFES
jgi:tetratricopeptide (TPR) repeat protein